MSTYTLIAIGNALVDTEFVITDTILADTALTRGSMTLTDADGQAALFATLERHGISATKQAGGGSAANSVAAFAALSGQDGSAYYHCRVGDDARGRFYLSDLAQMGVATGASAISAGQTGSCAVLVTPDGERTMQTHLGASAELSADNIDFNIITGATYLYLEGYLAMNPNLHPIITRLSEQARAQGVQVVVSFADPAVVRFAKDGLLTWLDAGVDMIFCNMEEARLFANTDDNDTAVRALLTYTRTAVVTNGAQPTTIGTADDIHHHAVPAADVVDTNGAGDNFAGAYLYAHAQGYTAAQCVTLAGTVASHVVTQYGARLPKDAYAALLAKIKLQS